MSSIIFRNFLFFFVTFWMLFPLASPRGASLRLWLYCIIARAICQAFFEKKIRLVYYTSLSHHTLIGIGTIPNSSHSSQYSSYRSSISHHIILIYLLFFCFFLSGIIIPQSGLFVKLFFSFCKGIFLSPCFHNRTKGKSLGTILLPLLFCG